MAASQVVSNHSEPFTELWAVLGKSGSSPTERASAYQALAGSLKGEVSPEFINALTNQYKKIITLVMDDIAAGTCPHEAIQLLGYCLFTPQFAGACGDDAGNIIGALCSVRYKKPAEKSTLTRALWCLSSQNFHSYQICHSVPQVVTLATEIILEHGFGSLAVESLNVFRRVHQQCPKEFGLVVSMWYKGIVVLMNCKAAKFQRKAHSFAIMFESSIASNSYLVGYLCKELKERVIAAMLGYMEERGKDPILIMNIWSHFVTVLGNALHKHSSFLNEMLRVVEMGFKHKVFLVQIAAYTAWRVLINNFSIEMDRLTQQRRLRLLLMPLLASAVKDKHEQVETARLLTWWHLIRKLGPNRDILFNQVCVPFLLFCLGVDPKLDLSTLPSVLADLGSWTHPTPLSLPPPDRLPTNQNKENLPAPRCPTGQGKTGSSGHGFSGRAGRLLTMLSSLSPGKKSDRLYQNTPKLGLVRSGCQAVLQFVGCDVTLHGSLLDTDGGSCVVYQKNAVPFEVIQFLTVFLDGALLYMVHYAKEVKEGSVESLVKSLFPVFLGTIKRESATDAKAASHLVTLLTSTLKWEAVTTSVPTSTRMELLSQLITLPPPLTSVITATHGPMYWSSVAHELINMASTEHNHPRFQSSWNKVVELSTSHSGGPASLSMFSELCTHLDRFVTIFDPDCPKKHQQPSATLHRMWTSLGQKFIGAVKEMSQVNEGTALDPNFATARRILKFPFLYRVFYNSEKLTMSVTFETWKEVYNIFCLHCSLVVKDPNHCAELVCRDIYDSYGQNVRGNSTTLDKSETVNFDWYQNTVGQALTHVLTKFNWIHLRNSVPGEGVGGRGGERGGKGGREGGVKTVQPLISVLSWQLATLWDTVQRSPMQIGHLSSPYTLMETVTLLYSNLPSRDLILTTTEMLGQPMVTLWQNVLESDAKPQTVNHKSLHKGPFDLQERIVKAWRAVLTCVQSRYGAPFTSDLLAALSPLLVLCLSCKRQHVVSETLTFWTATFDLAPEPLVYPNKLRDVLVKCRKKWDLQLKLPGFEQTSGAVAHSSVEDSLPHTDSSRHLPSQSAPADELSPHNTGVILPHPSPQRGVCGSFLGQKCSPRPGVPTTPPRSPAAQDMEEILARSRGHGGRGGAGVAKSPVLSARRRLSLNSDKSEDYVLVEPPAKRQLLLTEHQRERMRESIPVMYNALDPSQEPTQFTSQPDSEPVIIPESEGSPPTTVTTRSIFATSSEPRLPSVSSSTSSLVQGPSSSVHPRAQSQTFSHQLGSAPINSNASVSTNQVASSGVEACQMVSGIPQGHVRKSPISSRTRSRGRPEVFSTAPSGNGAPYPVALNAPPYYSVSRPFVPCLATGSMRPLRIAYHPLPSSPTLPASTHQLPPTSTPPPFSPTDQHYQTTVHGGPGFPAICTEPQQVYQLIQSGTGHPIMLPVPLRQPVITEAHPSSPSGPQFVPVIPQSIAAGPVAPTTSITPGVSSKQDPIFSPARYIFRPSTNPPRPYSLHSAPETSLPPLPLSAVIRPDLSATRRANKQRSSTQYSLPSTSGTPTTPSGSDRLLRGSVDAPIVIEDVEEPLPMVTGKTKDTVQDVDSGGEGSVRDNEILISSETDEQGQTSALAEGESAVAEPMDEARSVNWQLSEVAVAHKATSEDIEEGGEKVGQQLMEEEGKEDMEVVCGETAEEREERGSECTALRMTAKSPEKLPSSQPHVPISIESIECQSDSTGEKTALEATEDKSVTGAQSLEPLSESCEPGPALFEPPTSSQEEAPGSLGTDEPASDTGDSGQFVASDGGDPVVCEANEPAAIEKSPEANSDVPPTTTSIVHAAEMEGTGSSELVTGNIEQPDVKVSEEFCKSDTEGKKDEEEAEDESEIVREEEKLAEEICVTDGAGESQSQSEENQSQSEEKQKKESVDGRGVEEKTILDESPVRMAREVPAMAVTPTTSTAWGRAASPKTTPGGILKHVSQFDTPTSTAGRGRRVQFASSPVVFQPTKEGYRTPRHSRARSALSSRRILLKSDTYTKPSHSQKSQRVSSEPVFPSLTDCESPVEDILPVLSPCRFTHGLVHLVRARNIRTVGNISSLSKQEVQTLPIKSPKVENLKQALRNFQQHLGNKRRASLDSNSLGPPAKKRSRESGPEEVGKGETNTDQPQPQPPKQDKPPEPRHEESGGREDEDSQLSLVPSQASQSEPAVVLSSPDENNDVVLQQTAENEKGEPLQSAERMDDDSVFVEESQSVTSGDSQHVTDISTVEYRNENDTEGDEEDDTIETGSALEKSCPSPPMGGVGSPEIPLQSSPSESPISGTFDMVVDQRNGSSVQDSVSSDSESEGEREVEVEMELGETATDASAGSMASSSEESQQSTSLQHDHSYFSSASEGGEGACGALGALPVAEQRERVAVVSAAQLADHDYCSVLEPASCLEGDQPQDLPPPPSSTSDTELRSKLSSDIQDHNYCRQFAPNPPGATQDLTSELHVRDIAQNAVSDEPCNLASQELFSQSDDDHVANEPLADDPPVSFPVLSDIGCQTVFPDSREHSTSTIALANSSIPSDGDVESSLRSYVDGILGRDDLPVATLWKLHQQLMCSLFKVSEKLRAENS